MRSKGVTAAAALLLVGLGWGLQQWAPSGRTPEADPAATAFAERRSGVWMTLEGHVDRTLADDREGSRHQRFILRTSRDHTVLVAHNIDLAPRLEGLAAGEAMRLHGEYEWNAQGGVIHWTHHDPRGERAGGYIERQGRRYQ